MRTMSNIGRVALLAAALLSASAAAGQAVSQAKLRTERAERALARMDAAVADGARASANCEQATWRRAEASYDGAQRDYDLNTQILDKDHSYSVGDPAVRVRPAPRFPAYDYARCAQVQREGWKAPLVPVPGGPGATPPDRPLKLAPAPAPIGGNREMHHVVSTCVSCRLEADKVNRQIDIYNALVAGHAPQAAIENAYQMVYALIQVLNDCERRCRPTEPAKPGLPSMPPHGPTGRPVGQKPIPRDR